MQANKSDAEHLMAALTGTVLGLRRLPVGESAQPIDKGSLLALFETHRLGPLRPSALAAVLHLDLSTVSRHLRALEGRGLVQRTPDPADARAHRVAATPDGEDLLRRHRRARAAALATATTTWSASDLHTLTTLLERLAADLGDDGGAVQCPHPRA